jgi:galactokinase
VINTHAEHELAGSAYGDRRQSCEEAAAALETGLAARCHPRAGALPV